MKIDTQLTAPGLPPGVTCGDLLRRKVTPSPLTLTGTEFLLVIVGEVRPQRPMDCSEDALVPDLTNYNVLDPMPT